MIDRTNKILISYHLTGGVKKIPVLITQCELFKNPVVIKQYDNKLVFKRVDIDDNKTYKSYFEKSKYTLKLRAWTLPEGEFEFDEEESNEDVKVIYFKQDD